MKIEEIIIKNYKIFNGITIKMNNDVNTFVGENDSGKTTILEALSIALTGKLNGGAIINGYSRLIRTPILAHSLQ